MTKKKKTFGERVESIKVRAKDKVKDYVKKKKSAYRYRKQIDKEAMETEKEAYRKSYKTYRMKNAASRGKLRAREDTTNVNTMVGAKLNKVGKGKKFKSPLDDFGLADALIGGGDDRDNFGKRGKKNGLRII